MFPSSPRTSSSSFPGVFRQRHGHQRHEGPGSRPRVIPPSTRPGRSSEATVKVIHAFGPVRAPRPGGAVAGRGGWFRRCWWSCTAKPSFVLRFRPPDLTDSRAFLDEAPSKPSSSKPVPVTPFLKATGVAQTLFFDTRTGQVAFQSVVRNGKILPDVEHVTLVLPRGRERGKSGYGGPLAKGGVSP